MRTRTIILTITTLLITSLTAQAQNRKQLPPGEEQKYVVSAKPGIVNLIEGDLSVKRAKTGWAALLEANRGDWDKLIVGDDIRMNDSVKTGASSRAEVLLTPGTYLRLNDNTEIGFQFDGEFNQTITLRGGSMILEASVDGWITIKTPKSDVILVRAGVYRINATPDRIQVAVREGKAFLGETEVKPDRKATLDAGEPVVARFDKKSYDLFDTWSKDRAKSLVALNHSLSRQGLRNSGLISSFNNVWIFNGSCGCYTFLPWTMGFYSPYGWNYSVCNPYWQIHRPWYGSIGGGTNYIPPNSGSSGGGHGGGGHGYTPPPATGGHGGGSGGGGGYSPPPSHPSPPPPSNGGGSPRLGGGEMRETPAPSHRPPR